MSWFAHTLSIATALIAAGVTLELIDEWRFRRMARRNAATDGKDSP